MFALIICSVYFLNFAEFISIHEAEFKKHKNEAEWTPVSLSKLPYKPLKAKTKGMLKNYYGYLPYWVDTTYYQYLQLDLLTHISYFSVPISPSTGALGSIPNFVRFRKIRDYARPRGIKIHMTFTIFDNDSVRKFLNNATARINAINNIVIL